MERASRETWAKRIERWKDSGLTAKEFAAEVGISASSLSWWKWRLASKAKAADEKLTTSRPSPARSAAITKAPSLTPLTFIEMTAPPPATPLEIVLPSAIVVRVRPGFDGATLGRVLDVLERR